MSSATKKPPIQTLDSLCVRLSNVKFAEEKLVVIASRCQQGWESLLEKSEALQDGEKVDSADVDGEGLQSRAPLQRSMLLRAQDTVLAPARQALDQSGMHLSALIGAYTVFHEKSVSELLEQLYVPSPRRTSPSRGTMTDGPILNAVDELMRQLFHMVPESAFTQVTRSVFHELIEGLYWALGGDVTKDGGSASVSVSKEDAIIVRDDMTVLFELFATELDPTEAAEMAQKVLDCVPCEPVN